MAWVMRLLEWSATILAATSRSMSGRDAADPADAQPAPGDLAQRPDGDDPVAARVEGGERRRRRRRRGSRPGSGPRRPGSRARRPSRPARGGGPRAWSRRSGCGRSGRRRRGAAAPSRRAGRRPRRAGRRRRRGWAGGGCRSSGTRRWRRCRSGSSMATAAPGPPSAEAMRWTACWAPLVMTISSGSVGHAEAGHVRGEAGAQPAAGRTGRSPSRRAAPGTSSRRAWSIASAHERAGRQGADGQADGFLDRRGQLQQPDRVGTEPGTARRTRRSASAGPRRRCARRRGGVRLVQPRATGGDAGAAPLAAAGQAGQAQAVVGGDDGRPAEGQLAGQLALGRQAGAGRQEPGLDGARQRLGQLLVEGVGAGRPGPDAARPASAAETIDCLFSPLAVGLAIGLLRHACQYAAIPIQCQCQVAPVTAGGPDRKGFEMFDQIAAALAVAALFIAPARRSSGSPPCATARTAGPASATATSDPGWYPGADRRPDPAQARPRPTAGVVRCPAGSRGSGQPWRRARLPRRLPAW